jgi:hypothetical protein
MSDHIDKAIEYSESCDNESGSFLSHQLKAVRMKAYMAGWEAAKEDSEIPLSTKNANYIGKLLKKRLNKERPDEV